ncbi:kinase-like domain-containing protein [Glomus cerebriforme]|uniref:Kinase-like domain-containing protein n=1 Tax=Glomus cerebriforme TaxID=658196 RepID=A0A397T740_9GLOM|nr:kinase-like domain-containing protein [Glomus cerebriforme]
MEQKFLSDNVFDQIKDFSYRWLTKEQKLLIDKLILNEELKKGYKKYGLCKECKQPNTGYKWCNPCNAKHFQQNFKNWTSNNDNIDKFIQDTQLSAAHNKKVLEWIPYDRFYDIKYIARGGFGKVFKAKWIDGSIDYWDNNIQNWRQPYPNTKVALKSLNNSKNITLEFINEITLHHKVIEESTAIIRLYGITQDPDTKNYMMVLHYAKNGSLRNYLDINKLSWETKIDDLWRFAFGLNEIHKVGLIHRDLHIGNVLYIYSAYITDMGLCKPADYNPLENTKKCVYGVLPYIAPEILRGQNYTKAADIYSFGIIIYEVISGLPPYHDLSHDKDLAIKICQGLRPRFKIKVPRLIVHLIKSCLDANPLNRPSASEVENILNQWWNELINTEAEETEVTEIEKQIKRADEINNKLQTNVPSTGLSYETHSEAIYTSRLLNFNNLPEPKNLDDYYKQYDNVINMEYSETQQVDICQLKINNDELKERYEYYCLCEECKQPNTDTQLSAKEEYKVLEWIPYDRFYDIEYIAKVGFVKVYRANWIDGYLEYWDNEKQNWKRYGFNKIINKITSHHKVYIGDDTSSIIRLYGITQDPDTKNYMMVLQYARNGSLRNHLDISYNKLNWDTKIRDLYYIAYGLNEIHENNLIHQDLHIGNILLTYRPMITDMGLCKPADYYNALEKNKKKCLWCFTLYCS